MLRVTPLIEYPRLAAQLGLERVFVKREDENASGSHKDRAVWEMIEHYSKQGEREFVISSSGNAAISAAFFLCARGKGLGSRFELHRKYILHVFVSPRMTDDKKERLRNIMDGNEHIIKVHESQKAKSEAVKFAREHGYQLLRTSTDDLALGGYAELAEEMLGQLSELLPSVGGDIDIFVPTSSGTTLQGLFTGFEKHGSIPRLHIVQTERVHAMAKKFDTDFVSTKSSLSFAIVDTVAHRRDAVVRVVNTSGGGGWVVSDGLLKEARSLIEHYTDIEEASWDSLLSLAGLLKSLTQREVTHALLLFGGK